MKYLKTYNKLFESSNEDSVIVEDLLRDFSDDDFNVGVDIFDKFDMNKGEFVEGMIDLMVCIGGGSDKRPLTLMKNIQGLISMDEYLVDNGWILDDIELRYTIGNSRYSSRSIPKKYETKEFSSLIDMIRKQKLLWQSDDYRFHSLDFCYCKPKE